MSTVVQPDQSRPKADANLVYVVDDEAMIGEVVQTILRRDGFQARFFNDPEGALRSLGNDEPRPALLLTDYFMTPLNGLQLIERCKQIEPGLKTILYSGNSREDIGPSSAVEPDAFLRKPFMPKTLLNVVRLVLNAASLLSVFAALWLRAF